VQSREMLTDITAAALHKGLDGVYARQLAIADNVANLETPGYQAKQVSFEDSLHVALRAEQASTATVRRGGLIESVRPTEQVALGSLRRDGNTVNLETEILGMARSSTQYRVLSRLMSKRLKMLGRAINGGSRE
jgi:flagellar basal-body rod protein FlgB